MGTALPWQKLSFSGSALVVANQTFQVRELLKGKQIMRLMCCSLTLLKGTARYRVPGMRSDNDGTAREARKLRHEQPPFLLKREETKISRFPSLFCACLCFLEALCSQRGGCQTIFGGVHLSLKLGSCQGEGTIPSESEGCFSWQPGLYQRQAGSLVQSPDSIFRFLWLLKAGGWQGNIVSCEGSSCTGNCGACRWEEDSGPWDLLLMCDPALATMSCGHPEVENVGSCSWSWVWTLGIQPQTSKSNCSSEVL